MMAYAVILLFFERNKLLEKDRLYSIVFDIMVVFCGRCDMIDIDT